MKQQKKETFSKHHHHIYKSLKSSSEAELYIFSTEMHL